MESKNNKFDEKLKELIDQHSEQPPTHVWENIKKEKDRKKAGWIIFNYRWALLLLIFGLAGIGLYECQKPNEKLNSPSGKNKISEQPQNKQRLVSGSTSSTSEQHSEEKINSFSKEFAPPVNVNSTNAEINQSNIETNNKKEILIAVSLPLKKQIKNFSKKQQPNKISSESVKENSSSIKQQQGDIDQNNISQATDKNENIPSQTNDNITTANSVIIPDSVVAANTAVVDTIKTPDAKKANNLLVLSGDSTPSFSFALYVSPDYAAKQLHAKPAINSGSYLDIRKEGEERDFAYSAGVMISYAVTKHFFVRSGINYSEINETVLLRFKKEISTVKIDTLVRGFILDPFLPPQPYYLSDTSIVTLVSPYTIAGENKYIFVDIPLSVGYTFDFKRIRMYITAGVSLNIISSYKGKIVAPDSSYMLILEDAHQTPFIDKTGISIMAGFGCFYQISKKFDLMLEPNYSEQLNSITEKQYPLEQKYKRIGIKAGLSYKF